MDLENRQRLEAILFRNDGTSNSLHRISPTGIPAELAPHFSCCYNPIPPECNNQPPTCHDAVTNKHHADVPD